MTSYDVLPVRLIYRFWFVWMTIWASVCTIFFCTAVLIHNLFEPSLKTFHFWSKWWGRFILWGCGMHVKVKYHALLNQNQPYVFISNHQNLLDVLVDAGFIPNAFGFLAKIELQSAPFIGQVLKTFCVFVDRSTPRKAIESLQKGSEIVRNGHSVVVYPEGERTWSNEMVKWMRGAFDLAIGAGVPIVPLTLVNLYQHCDERRYLGKWGTLHLVIHEPISTADKTRKDIPKLMEDVESVVASELIHHQKVISK